MDNENPRRTVGDTLGTVALVFGILALVNGVLALIPLIGLALAIITGILALIAIGFGIPAVIKAASKNKCVVALVFGGLMLVWAIVRYFWVVLAVAAAAAA